MQDLRVACARFRLLERGNRQLPVWQSIVCTRLATVAAVGETVKQVASNFFVVASNWAAQELPKLS